MNQFSPPEDFDAVDLILQEQQANTAHVLGSLDKNPADAQRAYQLSDATGVDPVLIAANLKNFEQENKVQMTSELLNNNQYLRRFIEKDPLAAQLSNDDFGQLDAQTEVLEKFTKNTSATKEFFRSFAAGLVPAVGSLPAMAAGATIGGTYGMALGPVGAFAGALTGGVIGGLTAGTAIAAGQDIVLDWLPKELVESLGLDPRSRALGAKAFPTASFFGQMAPFALTFKPDITRLALAERGVSAGADAGFELGQQLYKGEEVNWKHVAYSALFGGVFITPNMVGKPIWDQGVRAAEAFTARVKPYAEAGVEPPARIDPLLDELKLGENEAGVNSLEQALAAAVESNTRQRNPNVFAEFVRLHTDANIGISPDAIKALYGDRLPTPDDGLLGWLPDLTTQMLAADATGADVRIPVADWIAKVDPAVATALRDTIRIRPDGLTKAEFEANPPVYSDLPPINEFDLMRDVAGLKPLGAPEQQSLRIEPVGEPAIYKNKASDVIEEAHSFTLKDVNGKAVGELDVTFKDNGKTAYIDNIYSKSVEANIFGPRVIRDLLRQFKQAFPKVETIEGFRITGARHHDKSFDAPLSQSFVSLKAAPEHVDWQTIEDNLRNRMPYDKLIPKDATVGGRPIKISEAGDTVQPLYTFSVRSAITSVAGRSADDATQYMHDFLGFKLSDAVGDVGILVLSPKDTQALYTAFQGVANRNPPAFYSPRSHSIVISDRVLSGEFAREYSQAVVLEEAIHAYTYKAIREDATIRGDLESMMADFKAAHDDQTLEAFKYRLSNPYEFIIGLGSDVNFRRMLETTSMSSETAAKLKLTKSALQKMGLLKGPTLWDGVKRIMSDILAKLLGTRPKDTIFEGLLELSARIDQFAEAHGRHPLRNKDGTPVGAEDLPPETPSEVREKAAFERASAIGMTEAQLSRYEKRMAEQQQEIIKAATQQAVKEQQKKQTELYKQRAIEERPEVVVDINSRPEVAADNFIRHKELFGQKIDGPSRIRTDSVPEEFRHLFPKEYFAKDGLHPDDLASMFGYPDAGTMLAHLAEWETNLKTSGMRPAEYKRMLINQEIDRRIKAKYGDPEETAINEAKDQVLAETTLEFLHEEMLALGLKHGLKFTMSADEIKAGIQENFAELSVRDISSDKFLASAGKSARDAEMALLKKDYAEAFTHKQRQYMSMIYAREARAFEKAQADFTKTAKKFSQRQVKGVNQEFTNFIHALMIPAELKVRRTMDDLLHEISMGTHETLPKFVDSTVNDGWDLAVAPEFYNGVKPISQMTVQEFKNLKDSIDSLAHIGRQVELRDISGRKVEAEEFRQEVLANLQQLPMRTKPEQRNTAQRLMSYFYGWDASLTRMEEMVKDLDLRKELGPLYRAIIEPMMRAKHTQYKLEEDLTKAMKTMKGANPEWIKTLDESLSQNFFIDPVDGSVFDLQRKHMINIMLNMGNKSNRDKFVKGYTKTKEEAKDLLDNLQLFIERHATKEDWGFVQNIWNLFKTWQKESDTLYRNMSGIAPKWIEATPIQTKFGDYEGGYFPVIYDKWRSDIDEKIAKANARFGPGYWRATTGNGYTKERTGFAAPIEFFTTLESVVGRMKQQIHDISFRSAVVEVNKVIHDSKIMGEVRRRYGEEYADQFAPWVNHIANYQNQNDRALSRASSFLRRARMNLSIHALGLNLKVILTPSVSTMVPVAKWTASWIPGMNQMNQLLNGGPLAEWGAAKLAWEKSLEIPHRYQSLDRNYREYLESMVSKGAWSSVQATAVRAGFWPMMKIEQGLRILTFNDRYKQGIAKGMTEADAVSYADSYVRERHGASGVPDLPAIMRGEEGMKLMTTFYGFFSTMYNWQRQIPGAIRQKDFEKTMAAVWGAVLLPAFFGAAFFNQADEKDSWWQRMGKAITLQPVQTIPFVREIASLWEGFPTRSPFTTILNAFWKGGKDVMKVMQGKRVEKPIQSGLNVAGLGLGLPLGQIGRTAQFLSDVNDRRERPRNILDWMRGIIFGPKGGYK